jgi:hypothetical protein
MEPQLPIPHSPETAPADNGQRKEAPLAPYGSEGTLPRVEHGPAISQERQGLEQQTQGVGGGDPNWQAQPAVSVASPAQASPAPVAPVTNDMPLVAKDDDLIEQEWVQKAKKIVAATKDDPYRQEQEVSKLQADYLQKRYGKEVTLSGE